MCITGLIKYTCEDAAIMLTHDCDDNHCTKVTYVLRLLHPCHASDCSLPPPPPLGSLLNRLMIQLFSARLVRASHLIEEHGMSPDDPRLELEMVQNLTADSDSDGGSDSVPDLTRLIWDDFTHDPDYSRREHFARVSLGLTSPWWTALVQSLREEV